MLLQILHRTTFEYDGAVRDSFNEVRLRPLDEERQHCRRFDLRLEPCTAARAYHDLYGNTVHYFEVPGQHLKLVIEAQSVVETAPGHRIEDIPRVSREELAVAPERELMAEFATNTPYVPLEVELWRAAQDALAEGRRDVWTDVCRLGAHVYRTLKYQPRTTGIDTRAHDALRLRTGVCQDFAHVLLGLCRSIGIPARYVSGYFFNESRRADEPEASHAWVEAFVPGYGWASWDPTHDRPADERYVKIAVGRDYADIRPVNGTYRGAPARELRVDVAVRQTDDPVAAPEAIARSGPPPN